MVRTRSGHSTSARTNRLPTDQVPAPTITGRPNAIGCPRCVDRPRRSDRCPLIPNPDGSFGLWMTLSDLVGLDGQEFAQRRLPCPAARRSRAAKGPLRNARSGPGSTDCRLPQPSKSIGPASSSPSPRTKTIRRPPAPLDAAPVTPSQTSPRTSTPRGRRSDGTAVHGGRPTDPMSGRGSPSRLPASRRPRPTALRPGRFPRCGGLSVTPPGSLPRVSIYTIRLSLYEAGTSYQRTCNWCPSGLASRLKAGLALVTNPGADAKK